MDFKCFGVRSRVWRQDFGWGGIRGSILLLVPVAPIVSVVPIVLDMPIVIVVPEMLIVPVVLVATRVAVVRALCS